MQQSKKSMLVFNKRERRAVLFILLLIVLTRLLPEGYARFFIDYPKNEQPLKIIRTGQMILAESTGWKNEKISRKPGAADSSPVTLRLFYFDPNKISSAEWKTLGLNDRAISSVRKYISKGGRFRKPDDIFRIWHIDSAKARELLPFVRILENNIDNAGFKNERRVQQKITIVDINKADSADLEALPGLGPALSSRIVAYRKLLGGYASLNQIKEVYGLKDSAFNIFLPYIKMNPHKIEKININAAGYDTLKRHPYIGYRFARIIIQYRNQHGPFSNPDDLKKIMVFDDAAVVRLLPYIDFGRVAE